MKTFFDLKGAYQGLRARRLSQCGRVVFYKIVNDPPDYWLVVIRAFNEERDRPLIRHLSRFGNGVWRFGSLHADQQNFTRLATFPEYAAEEKKRQKTRRKNSERLREYQWTGGDS